MGDVMKKYWDGTGTKNKWLYLIDDYDEFEIYTTYGCDGNDEYFHGLDGRKNVVFVMSGYVNGECKLEKCIDDIDGFVDDLVIDLLLNDDGVGSVDIVIVGNPELLSFEMQYLLFRNVNIIIGVYNPLLMAVVLMERESVVFEVSFNDRLNMRHLAIMTGMRHYKTGGLNMLV